MLDRPPAAGRRRIVPPRPAVLAAGRLLATGEVARALGISNRTVLAWALAGRLPSITTPGGHRRYPSAEIVRIAAHMGLAWARAGAQDQPNPSAAIR
jgi:excisionase family DNA binding protein